MILLAPTPAAVLPGDKQLSESPDREQWTAEGERVGHILDVLPRPVPSPSGRGAGSQGEDVYVMTLSLLLDSLSFKPLPPSPHSGHLGEQQQWEQTA